MSTLVLFSLMFTTSNADLLPYYPGDEYGNYKTFHNVNLTWYSIYDIVNGRNLEPVKEWDFVGPQLVLIKQNEVNSKVISSIYGELPSDTLVIELPTFEYRWSYSSDAKLHGKYREIIYNIESTITWAKMSESTVITNDQWDISVEHKKYNIYSKTIDEYLNKNNRRNNKELEKSDQKETNNIGLIQSDKMINDKYKPYNPNEKNEKITFNSFLKSWIITIFIETLILYFLCKIFSKKDDIKNRRIVTIWIIASSVTLPLLWFIFPLFINDYGTSVLTERYIIAWNNYNHVHIDNHIIFTVVWEAIVTLIEVFIIKYWLKISRGKAILASIVCNLCSYLLWLIVF